MVYHSGEMEELQALLGEDESGKASEGSLSSATQVE